MIGFFSKMFGGNKSEKDVRAIQPNVTRINEFFQSYQSLSNDELRSKTTDFRKRIQDHLRDIDREISETNQKAEALDYSDLVGKDTIYQQVDVLKKDRDKKIEEILKEILPEAFA